MQMLFQAHSGLRYLVLLAGVAAALVMAVGLFSRRAAYDRPARTAMAVFAGVLDLQIVLGIVLVALGVFYPSLMGHLTMMLLAAVAVHAASVLARKQGDPRRAYSLGLIGAALALLLIVLGIHAIGRGVFQSRPGPSAGVESAR
jgi:heme A synthase